MAIEYKSISTQVDKVITDVDTKSGIVKGYFSVFGNKDSDGDVIMQGAFKKSLQENYRRIKHLWQHDVWRPLSGTKNDMLKVYEDSYGLAFESKISETSYGKDALVLYQDGVVDEQSVGFITIKAEDKGSYREIREVKLFEGSAVTWGANEMAQVVSVKHMVKEQLLAKADKVSKLISSGKFENEDMFEMLDYYLKQLHTALATQDTSTTQPLTNESTEPDYKNLKLALSLFNLKTNTY